MHLGTGGVPGAPVRGCRSLARGLRACGRAEAIVYYSIVQYSILYCIILYYIVLYYIISQLYSLQALHRAGDERARRARKGVATNTDAPQHAPPVVHRLGRARAGSPGPLPRSNRRRHLLKPCEKSVKTILIVLLLLLSILRLILLLLPLLL